MITSPALFKFKFTIRATKAVPLATNKGEQVTGYFSSREVFLLALKRYNRRTSDYTLYETPAQKKLNDKAKVKIYNQAEYNGARAETEVTVYEINPNSARTPEARIKELTKIIFEAHKEVDKIRKLS